MNRIAAVLALVACPVLAQTSPVDGAPDGRFRTIDYYRGGPFTIATAPESTQTVLFAPGERITAVILSNPQAFQVSVAPASDSIAFRAASPTSSAIVNIRTDQRQYELDLVPANAGAGTVPLVISFSYGAAAPVSRPSSPPPPPLLLPEIAYAISGSRALRPVTIGDDGRKTYIAWRDDQPIPAVFALGPSGAEEMVNGYVRAGTFTIDRVYDQLLFRIDREVTIAKRGSRQPSTQKGKSR